MRNKINTGILFLLFTVVCFSLTACGGDNDDNDGQDNEITINNGDKNTTSNKTVVGEWIDTYNTYKYVFRDNGQGEALQYEGDEIVEYWNFTYSFSNETGYLRMTQTDDDFVEEAIVKFNSADKMTWMDIEDPSDTDLWQIYIRLK